MGRYPERPGRCSSAPARTHWECSQNPMPAGHAGASWGEGGVVRLPWFVAIARGEALT